MPWGSDAGLYHLHMPLVIGATAAGFCIVRQLGYEEFGELYVAEHPRLPRQQVLHLIPAEISIDLDYRVRFNQESDQAAALWHPNIAGLTDRGEFEDQLWISTEYIDGLDAAELLGEGHLDGMPPRMVIEIVSAIAARNGYADRLRDRRSAGLRPRRRRAAPLRQPGQHPGRQLDDRPTTDCVDRLRCGATRWRQ